jgi:hypothetical protein
MKDKLDWKQCARDASPLPEWAFDVMCRVYHDAKLVGVKVDSSGVLSTLVSN